VCRGVRELRTTATAATTSSTGSGRPGGDEFVAVLPGVGTDDEAIRAAGRLQEALRSPVHGDGQVLNLGASIGVAVAPGDGDDVDTLLRHADEAMFRARSGRLGVCVHGRPT
jgi:diguanylate cyclase (GGDEF)-like protein